MFIIGVEGYRFLCRLPLVDIRCSAPESTSKASTPPPSHTKIPLDATGNTPPLPGTTAGVAVAFTVATAVGLPTTGVLVAVPLSSLEPVAAASTSAGVAVTSDSGLTTGVPVGVGWGVSVGVNVAVGVGVKVGGNGVSVAVGIRAACS